MIHGSKQVAATMVPTETHNMEEEEAAEEVEVLMLGMGRVGGWGGEDWEGGVSLCV
jgi:hypothetical protein